ncbi:hypothetical protein MINTM019_29800 [Mycobacterium paraintracellulare]|uniref:Uncharacterized protein n=1 Tax=Mycobacterium paraintracellulare TaxID=1138383 RepID=A0ABN6AYY1_9MYCO|nr:hypothetical protein MPRI_48320 [Mycobacterium paraintracellulare]BCP05524.1 hypothetical protein MINTM019_29800 [Mycobacterium paraintracellulare]
MAGGTGYSLHYRMGPTRLPALSVDALDRLTESICYLDKLVAGMGESEHLRNQWVPIPLRLML